ncbi:MAG: 30S ribosomal protein S20 [Alphaproteobacteria bacterium]|nr:30S ribosomal protein S20 [Alphaproteobacteria bacterium]|tara:strand:- start:51 stop:317 length:267 start_codon:yes stop_codon:yes gene_type:complete
MANIKSAKKRILQSQKKTEFNKFRKTRIRSVIKSLNTLISNKKKDDSRKSFLALESELSKAVSKGVYKKNTASRIVSRLSQKLKLLAK